MESTKYLSVIMPARNAEKTITSALLSLLVALPKDSEINVFLDGCTDNTKRKILRLRSKRIRIFESPESVGVATALNNLIEVSLGKYIARQDADDMSLPWRFFALRRKLKNADFVFASQINFNPSRFVFIRQPLPLPLNNIETKEVLLRANTLVHSSLITKIDVLKEMNGYNRVPAEDYNLWLRAIQAGYLFRKFSIPSVLFRRHQGQITNDPAWRAANSASSANTKLIEELGNDSHSTESDMRFFQKVYVGWLERKLASRTATAPGQALGLSLLDSVFWRIGTLLITLLVASFSSPADYALYAASALGTTFFQGLIEGVLRLQQVSQMLDSRSRDRLSKYSLFAVILSIILLPIVLLGITFSLTGSLEKFFMVTPFVLALPVMRISTLSQIKLQAHGNWRLLTRLRVVSVILALTILVPSILVTKSVFIGAFSLALAELVFVILFKLWKPEFHMPLVQHPYAHIETQRRYFDAIDIQVNLWIRTQLDRVLIIGFASTKLVAFYLLVYTLAKTPTETLSSGLNRFMKSIDEQVFSLNALAKTRKRVFIVQGLTLLFVATSALLGPTLSGSVPMHLNEVLTYLPLFATAAIPAALSSTIFELRFRANPRIRYLQIYGLTIVFALLISLSLQFLGYYAAGIFLLGKEIGMSLYWYKSSRLPKGSGLLTQTFLLTAVSLLVASVALVV
jgi:hypothetical protein